MKNKFIAFLYLFLFLYYFSIFIKIVNVSIIITIIWSWNSNCQLSYHSIYSHFYDKFILISPCLIRIINFIFGVKKYIFYSFKKLKSRWI